MIWKTLKYCLASLILIKFCSFKEVCLAETPPSLLDVDLNAGASLSYSRNLENHWYLGGGLGLLGEIPSIRLNRDSHFEDKLPTNLIRVMAFVRYRFNDQLEISSGLQYGIFAHIGEYSSGGTYPAIFADVAYGIQWLKLILRITAGVPYEFNLKLHPLVIGFYPAIRITI